MGGGSCLGRCVFVCVMCVRGKHMTGLCVRGWPASQPPPLPAPSYPPFPLAHHVHACLPTTCTPACPPHARLLDHHMQACLTTPCTPACPPHACLLAHHMHACLPTTCTPACCCPPHAHLLAHHMHTCLPTPAGPAQGEEAEGELTLMLAWLLRMRMRALSAWATCHPPAC